MAFFEEVLLSELRLWHELCGRRNVSYAFWGGVGVAAHLGHLPRQVKDVDIVVERQHMHWLAELLDRAGYQRENGLPLMVPDYYGVKRVLRGFTLRLHLFGETFYFVDGCSGAVVTSYSLARALQNRMLGSISCVERSVSVEVFAFLPEDLILTKLLPRLHPGHLHDIFYLLARAELDMGGLSFNAGTLSPVLLDRLRQNLVKVEEDGPRSCWWSDSTLRWKAEDNLLRFKALLRASGLLPEPTLSVCSSVTGGGDSSILLECCRAQS